MPRGAKGEKPAKVKVEADLAVLRKSLKNEAARRRQLEKRLAEAQEQQTASAEVLQTRNRERAEAQEQQTATAEILRVISSSPTDLQPVLDTVAENAARVCGANDALIFRVDGGVLRLVAVHGSIPLPQPVGDAVPMSRSTVTGRSVRDRRTIHVEDIMAAEAEFPETVYRMREAGYTLGTILVTPLLREGVAIGAIGVRRTDVRPFTEKQVALLQTFADQAVIAIENVRLFNETKEALEQQTATSEILRIISSSPTDVQPVFDTIVARAVRLCGGLSGGLYRFEAGVVHLVADASPRSEAYAPIRAAYPKAIDEVELTTRPIYTQGVVSHLADVEAEPGLSDEFRKRARVAGYRSIVGVPMVRDGHVIGAITVARAGARLTPRPFSDREIGLLKTFAAQAVIAVENVRLFQELQARNHELTRALEQQTATSEVLKLVSRSTFDVQPVLETLIESTVRLCGAEHGHVYRFDGELLQRAAGYGSSPEHVAFRRQHPIRLWRGSLTARAALDRRVVHVPDVLADPEYGELESQRLLGIRTGLSVPLLKENVLIGVLAIWRTELRPFTDAQVALVKTFADQAVIAIENVRLFTELQEKNWALTEAHAQVTEALDQQTATAEILRVISSSPTDVHPVFDAIATSAVRVCEAGNANVYQFDGHLIHLVASHGYTAEELAALKGTSPIPPGRGSATARAVSTGAIAHIPDMSADPDFAYPVLVEVGFRTSLSVPMLRDGKPKGAITVAAREVRPFSDRQIALLQTFADQAVIAVENVRLFQELQTRNAELTESLEQQTATADILRVISSSPTDLQPVMDAVAENAARVCGATDSAILRLEGEHLRLVAQHGSLRRSMTIGDTAPVSRDIVGGQAVCDRRTIHVGDLMAAEAQFPETVSRHRQTGSAVRTLVATPLLREGTPLGVIVISRGPEVHPFSAKQIALLETFANQAVIAIENVRLFQELRARTAELTRSVAQLTALGEVSRAVSSTLDVEAVLDTIVSRASHLAGADGCSIYEYDERSEQFHLRSTHNLDAAFVEAIRAVPLRKGEGLMGRATEMREPVQIPDITQPEAYQSGLRDALIRFGYRALLSVPLLREDQIIGSLSLNRKAPGAFPPEVIDVLKTFATQSALAIQNARLFREIEDKSRLLEAASRHKSEFLANMSHELRTPLNAIIGFSEVLAERMFGEVNEKQAEYLQDILSSGRHLLSLINDILDLSKVEAGRLELELGRFHLPTALDNALTLVRERATGHGITLTRSVDERVGDIVADERKVKQILLNLLSNAVKFTLEGGRIGLTATATDGVISISVSDTGIGIAPEDQAAIFEEFRQVGRDDARTQEGTGLGLTLAKKFVELHGGQIWVRSQVGQGSTFTFTLPVRPEAGSSSDQGGGAPPLDS